MINNIKRGSLSNAIAFHDFKKTSINWKEWFYYIEEWFRKGGLIPNRISGASGKTIKFENGKKKLEKKSFKSIEYDGVWVIATPPEVGTEMFDFIFAVDLHDEPNGKKTLVLCWDDQIIKFDQFYIENLAKDLYEYLEPAYGYAYQRPFKLGPSFYPFGVSSGLDYSEEEEKEADQISKWADEYGYEDGDYKTGLMRDIYPMNFLSEVHFKQKIEGQNLKSWIESSSENGELKQLADNLWSWWVPKDKIPAIREKFIPTGLLLSF